jgi:hypothetical protein
MPIELAGVSKELIKSCLHFCGNFPRSLRESSQRKWGSRLARTIHWASVVGTRLARIQSGTDL